VFFFFKQKTAYEVRLSLVGSEMCIRDSIIEAHEGSVTYESVVGKGTIVMVKIPKI